MIGWRRPLTSLTNTLCRPLSYTRVTTRRPLENGQLSAGMEIWRDLASLSQGPRVNSLRDLLKWIHGDWQDLVIGDHF